MENSTPSSTDDTILSRPLEEKILFFAVMAAALVLVIVTEDTERMYWPYMLGSYAMAALVFLYETHRITPEKRPTLLRYLLPSRVWFHRSAGHDFAITLINVCLLANLSSYLLFYSDTIVHHVSKALHGLASNTGASPSTGVIIFYTLVSWIFADILHYFAHRASHEVRWLWEFHKVHHSARTLNPLTVSRAHPVDVLLIMGARTLGEMIAAVIFLYFYPNLHGVKTVGGVNLFIFIAYFLGTNMHHMHIWMSYGPLEYIFLSPSQHQIHHSENPQHYNRNYASILTLWDTLFGTVYITKGKEDLTFGLGEETKNYQTLRDIYIRPVKRAFRRPKKTQQS